MEAKKLYFTDCHLAGKLREITIEKVIDIAMIRLFQLAEVVCNRFPIVAGEPVVTKASTIPHDVVPTIRFHKEEKVVEGELF